MTSVAGARASVLKPTTYNVTGSSEWLDLLDYHYSYGI